MNDVKPEININTITGLIESGFKRYMIAIDPELNYNNLVKLKTTTYKDCMRFIFNLYFRDSNIRNYRDNSAIDKNDIALLNVICDVYLSICDRYNKQLGITGYSELTGIDQSVIWLWGENATGEHYTIYKRLRDNLRDSSEASLKDSDIGRIAVANNSAVVGLNYGYAAAAQQAAATAPRLETIAGRYSERPKISD